MVKFLNNKRASLLRAFEAGARTRLMGTFGTLPRLEILIKTPLLDQIYYKSLYTEELRKRRNGNGRQVLLIAPIAQRIYRPLILL